jgi:hypothetical protein
MEAGFPLKQAALVLLLLCASVLTARAQLVSDRRAGDLSLGVYGMAGQGFHQELSRGQGFSEFATAAVEASCAVSRRLELQLDFHPLMFIRQPAVPPHGERETVAAFALDVGLRWSPAPSVWRIAPYLEILAGPFYAVARVPTTGTRFNFLTQTGFGAVLPLGRRWHPEVFGRWAHISNAGTGQHNPDWDYWAVGVGARLALPDRRWIRRVSS